MKKLTALMLALLIALSAATTLAGAAVVTTEPAPTWTTTEPDLIITEMCPDTAGDVTGGWTCLRSTTTLISLSTFTITA